MWGVSNPPKKNSAPWGQTAKSHIKTLIFTRREKILKRKREARVREGEKQPRKHQRERDKRRAKTQKMGLLLKKDLKASEGT